MVGLVLIAPPAAFFPSEELEGLRIPALLAAGDRFLQRQVLALGEAELLGELGGNVERDDDGLVGLGSHALDAQRMEVERHGGGPRST